MRTQTFVLLMLASMLFAGTGLLGCESKADKCKKVCADVVAKEHGADSQAVKDCNALCDKATQ